LEEETRERKRDGAELFVHSPFPSSPQLLPREPANFAKVDYVEDLLKAPSHHDIWRKREASQVFADNPLRVQRQNTDQAACRSNRMILLVE